MATTQKLTIRKDGWTVIPRDGNHLAVQVNVMGIVKLHVADAAPDDGSDVGVVVARQRDGLPGSFACGGLGDATGVYARVDPASTDADTIDIVFISY